MLESAYIKIQQIARGHIQVYIVFEYLTYSIWILRPQVKVLHAPTSAALVSGKQWCAGGQISNRITCLKSQCFELKI